MVASAFLAAVLGLIVHSPVAYAAGREVGVVDSAYQPSAVQIQAGDSVVWHWASKNASTHTVTALDGSFDSDRGCSGARCRAPGHEFTWKFTQPGIYAYRCKVHVMLGRVEVVEAKPPQQPPQQPPPGPPAGPQRQGGQTKSQAGPPPAPPPPPPPGASGGAPSKPRMAAAPGMTYARVPVVAPAPAPAPAPRAVAPAIAPPRDLFSLLPEPRPAPVEPAAPVEPPAEEFAVEVPAGQPEQRTGLVVGLAVVTLLTTAAAFGKVVLFGRPWP